MNIGNRQDGRPFGKSIYHASSCLESIEEEMAKLKFNYKKMKIIKPIYQGKNTVSKITKILSNVKLSNIKRKKFNDIRYEL